MAVELATGYVTLTVETSQVSKAIGRAFSQGEGVAASSGKAMASSLSKAMQNVQTTGLDKLQAGLEDSKRKAESAADAMERSEKRLSDAAEQAARKRANAATQVEIAEQRVKEVREKSNATASQIMAAEDKAQRARQKYIDVSRDGVSKLSAYSAEVESTKSSYAKAEEGVRSARAELDKFEADAKDAAGEAEKTGNRFTRAFSGVGEKISGAFRGAFDPAKVEATQASDHISREMGEAGNKSGGAFKNSFKGAIAGLGVYVGATEILGGVKTAINNAGNLEQSVGAVDSVFKDSAGQMQAWSFQAAQSVGLSKNAYNELASKLGASLKNAGTPMDELGGKTNDLITMGADLASMFGGTTAEAIDAIGSALRGEMDPIEKYGISLNDAALTAKGLEMGIEKTGGAFTTQQKQLITQALLFEQSADAQGNFAKESDTFQGKLQRAGAQWENVSTKMGELFLPVLSKVLGFIGDRALPAIDAFVGGIRAFGGAWEANDGIVTSSGFAGAMEQIAFHMRSGYEWMTKWYPVWAPFAAGIASMTGAFVAYKVALTAVSAAQAIMTGVTTAWQVITGIQTGTLWGLTTAQWAALAPIALTIGALVALGVGLKMAYDRVGWFRDMVDGAWAWIKGAISGVVSWFTDTAVPSFQSAISAIGDWFTNLYTSYIAPAWGNVKQVVSSVISWFTDVASPAIGGALSAVGAWFSDLYTNYVQPAFTLIGSFVTSVISTLGEAFTWLYETVIKPVWTGILIVVTAIAAILLTIFQGIAWVVSTTLGPVFMWLWESVIKPVWSWIQTAIQGFMDWWSGTAVPIIQAAIGVIGAVWSIYKDRVVAVWSFIIGAIQGFMNWWSGTAVPIIQAAVSVVISTWQFLSTAVGIVWDWISTKISSAWSWIQGSVLTPAKAFIEGVLVPVFHFLWNQVSNVWDWISSKIAFIWTTIKNTVLTPMVTFLDGTVGEGFRSLWKTVSQVWDWISDKINTTWSWVKSNVLDPLGDYMKTTVVGFFEAARDGIGKVWDGIKDLVSEPVRFVVDTVINGGLIKNYNNLNDFWGGENLEPIKLGFARGGVIPGYQSAKKDEVLTPMRKGEGVIVPEATRVLGHSFIHGLNGAANRGGTAGASNWLSRNFGQGYAKGGVISPLKQRFPLSQGYNRVHKGIDIAAPTGTPIYATADGAVTHAGPGARAPGVWGGNEIHVKSGGIERWFAHLSEIAVRAGQMISQGDYLGKTGNTGISSGPHLHFGVFSGGWPNDLNPLDYLGGAVNFDSSDISGTGGGGGGSSILGLLAEKLSSPVRALLGSAKEKFGGNGFAQIPFGFAENMLDRVVEWAGGQHGGSESSGGSSTNWTSTVKEALGRTGLPVRDDYVGAWMRQIQSESGGNPRAVQNGYTDVNTLSGDLAQGLVQVIGSTFRAYRDPALPNDRFNPLANLTAGMRYAKARYGANMLGVIGHGHGYARGGIIGETPALYDKGGIINRGLQIIDHQRATPDYVLTDTQWDAMIRLAQVAETQQASSGITIGAVHGYTADEVAEAIEKQRQRHEALYAMV